MNNDEMYPKQKMSKLMLVLWVFAAIAVVTVIGLFLWGKSIHDGLSA